MGDHGATLQSHARRKDPPTERSVKQSTPNRAPTTVPQDPAERVWVDVIRKMDETYEDLLRYQVELERKNAELEETQAFLASVQAAMTDVLIVCDIDAVIQQVNHSLETLTGQSSDYWTGRPLQELLSPSSSGVLDMLRERLPACSMHDIEVHIVGQNEPVPLSLNCSCRYDQRQRPMGAVIIGRPVGELRKAYAELNVAHRQLKQAQQNLVQSEKMASLGRLVAGVAHELNNPISFVYGNVHMLGKYTQRLAEYLGSINDEQLDERQRQRREDLRIERILKDLEPLMEGTLEGTERVRDIIEDLRAFSSGQKARDASFDLAHVARTAVHWVLKGGDQAIEIRIVLPQALTMKGNAGQMHQVIMNLVQNARDAIAGRPEPKLLLRGGREGESIWLEVHDNGPGVSTEDREKVFEPFFTRKPVGQGTGLGLSISYGIVADHGGVLSVDDSPLGGAVFRINFPQASE